MVHLRFNKLSELERFESSAPESLTAALAAFMVIPIFNLLVLLSLYFLCAAALATSIQLQGLVKFSRKVL
jgi:hypothetical protein